MNFFSSKNVSHILSILQYMMLHHFLRQKRFSHSFHITVHDASSLSSSKTFITFTAFNLSLFSCMVGNIMSGEFLFIKKYSSHSIYVTAHEASSHSLSKNVYHIYCIKSFTFQLYGIAFGVSSLFSSKKVYHISCNIEFMVGNIMSDEFLFV